MKTIHKYPIRVAPRQYIPMPRGAQILCVQLQQGVPHIWALVNTDYGSVDKIITTHATGGDAENAGTYIGTYQMGPLVWHIFEGG